MAKTKSTLLTIILIGVVIIVGVLYITGYIGHKHYPDSVQCDNPVIAGGFIMSATSWIDLQLSSIPSDICKTKYPFIQIVITIDGTNVQKYDIPTPSGTHTGTTFVPPGGGFKSEHPASVTVQYQSAPGAADGPITANPFTQQIQGT